MIFITLGTTRFPTSRYDDIVENLVSEFPEERIIYQSPGSKLISKRNLIVRHNLDPKMLIKYLKEAKVNITHGGPATIFLALHYSKKIPLVIPRLKIFNEHVNDHQRYFSEFISRKKLAKVLKDPEIDFKKLVNYCRRPINNYSRQSNSDMLSNNLILFIENQRLLT